MRATRLALTKTSVNGRRYYCVTTPRLGGGRKRRFFKERAHAETYLQLAKVQQANYGTAALSIPDALRVEAVECAQALEPFGVTLRDAVKFYLPHLHATKRSCTAAELVDELRKVKEADGASTRYLADLRSRLNQFAAVFDGQPVARISAPQIDQWLRSLADKDSRRPLAPVTRNHIRRLLVVAFNFAKSRGYCIDNPAEKSAKAKEIDSPVGILSVEQTARLLESADPVLVPYIAIGAFAGLRRAELERLDWKEVDLASGLIEVTAANSKSARRRFVKIQPALAQWLKPYAQHAGNVTPPGYAKLLLSAREAAGITQWPPNALRHGFASYHLAHFNDAAALSLELGHANAQLVFQHYRQLVKPKQAERYWKITLGVAGRKVVQFVTA
jgi:integrase